MGKLINIAGQRFGFWIVNKLGPKKKNGQTQWLCTCECGNQKLITSNSLRTGNSTSCGCNHKPDLTNQKFGKLLVVKVAIVVGGHRYWECQCECTKKIISSTFNLRNSKITSCGCDSLSKDSKKILKDNMDSIVLESILKEVTEIKKILYLEEK